MKRSVLKILFLLVSYVVSFLIIYMALTNTGIFENRLKAKMKAISHEMRKSFEKVLSKCELVSSAVLNDPNIKLIFFQFEIEGNKREYIGYLSKLRSSVNNVYKIALLRPDGSLFVSSEYFEKEFKEFSLAKKYLKPDKITFFGSFDVLYSISSFYDQRGILKGYLVIGWYKDMFKQYNIDLKNVKFVQDLILVNFPDEIRKINVESSFFIDRALVSEKISKYGLSILLYKPISSFDLLNVIVVVLLILFSLMITVWFLVDFINNKKMKMFEEIKDEILYGIEGGINYQQESMLYGEYSKIDALEEKGNKVYEEEKHKYEEIEADIVPVSGELAQGNVLSVREVFDFVISKLRISKVMLMRRVEDGFVEVISEGFETSDFVIYFTDKVWEKFLSKGKAVSIKGDIKELYELGARLKDELFEITIFPVLDMFRNVLHLLVTGRKWTENDPGIEAKKEVFAKVKYLVIQ